MSNLFLFSAPIVVKRKRMTEYMNMTVQVPIEIAEAAKNGQAEIMGLSKDAATKQIMRHLPAVEPAQEAVNAAVSTEPATKDMNKGTVAAVVVVGALVIAASVTWFVVCHNKKKKEATALTNELHNEVSTYVDGIQDGSLEFDDLKMFTDFIGGITKNAKGKKLKISLSPDELVALRSIVAKVTVEAVKQKDDGSEVSAIAKPVVALKPRHAR